MSDTAELGAERRARVQSKSKTGSAKRKPVDNLLQAGVDAHRKGDLDTAEQRYRAVLKQQPEHPTALNDLGILLIQRRQREQGEDLIRKATELKPDYAEAHANLATLLRDRGEIEAAIAAFEKAIAAKPDYADAHMNLGACLEKKGDTDAALAAFGEALRCKPDHPEALFRRGSLLRTKGRLDEALEDLRKCIELHPQNARAHERLAAALGDSGALDEAIASYRHAIDLAPNDPQAHANLGLVLSNNCELDAAIAAYRRAIELKPDWSHAHFGLSLVLLQKGDYAAGWDEYEWRWKGAVEKIKPRELPKPQWQGEDLTGKTLLLYAEQGLGDSIQFVRFIPALAARGGKVVLEAPQRLLAMLRMSGIAEHMIAAGAKLPEFDYHLPLLSLPSVIRLDRLEVPAEPPYLLADPVRIAKWRRRLPKDAFRVGVVWQGFPNAEIDKGRSIPLRSFAPVAQVPQVRLISLQKNYGLDQLTDLPDGLHVETLGDGFDSGPDAFLDTAAVMASLDLIITSDTSVAHVAGALGRPVWIALKYSPDWRWLLGREDSPWYPTARLFRQRVRGDWDEVLQRVAAELQRVTGGETDRLSAPGMLSPGARRGAAAAVFERAFALHREGKLDQALASYRRVLTIDPEHAEANGNLGVILHGAGRIDDAISMYRRAIEIKPDHAPAHANLAIAIKAKGHPVSSVDTRRGVGGAKPVDADAHVQLGDALRRKGDIDGAIAAYEKALAVKPDDARTRFNLAYGWHKKGELDRAIEGYRKAALLNPELAQVYANLGVALIARGKTGEGVVACRRAVELKPQDARYHSNLGSALKDAGDLTAAIRHYELAAEIEPGFAEGHANLALALSDRGEIAAAVERNQKAIALRPGYAEAHFNLSLLLLQKGQYAEGWREYEWRLKGGAKDLKLPEFRQPRWQGEPIVGRTILLCAEQGLGDTLQFARFIPALAARGAKVLLAAPKELVAILQRVAGAAGIFGCGEKLPKFDFHLPLMSAPHVLGVTELQLPAHVPYLSPEPERVNSWREKLGDQGYKVGIVWQGRPGVGIDKGRSIPLRAFAPLSAIPGVRLICLQKSHGLDQLDNLPTGMKVETLGADFDADPGAFLDSAAVMANLDLVVTCDTSVAHLAGALGRPVWTALKHLPDWRWLLEREDSPWYPTARLFRQREPGDWGEVFGRIARELDQTVRSRHGAVPGQAPSIGRIASPVGKQKTPVLLDWTANSFSGWGVGGLNLLRQWGSDPDLTPVMGDPVTEGFLSSLDELKNHDCAELVRLSNAFQNELKKLRSNGGGVDFPVIHPLGNVWSKPNFIRGSRNIGRSFFEHTNLARLDEKLAPFDMLLCASNWNAELVRAKCSKPVELVFEGIDPALFHPGPKAGFTNPSRFYVFSGGKVELRKGQDLVLLAFREFARRHDDAVLVTMWHSPWPNLSAGFRGRLREALTLRPEGTVDVISWVERNGVKSRQVIDLGRTPNAMTPAILREMDCVLAPSRAEGGTNLVVNEAMACGIPVIVAANTGATDIIAEGNSIPLRAQGVVRSNDETATEGWGESDPEEIIAALEALYTDSQKRTRIGKSGAEWILSEGRTWENHARRLKAVVLSL